MTAAIDLNRTVEALLFLSPTPVSVADLAEACEATEAQVEQALELLGEDLAPGRRGVTLREVAGGYTLASDPEVEASARRLLSRPRTPPLTQAVTLFALLEMHKTGEATWTQRELFGPIEISAPGQSR